MATKLPSLLLCLLLISGFQEMMMIRPGEAAICQAPSRIFRGACFSDKNCGSICEKEGFVFGECKRLKCMCKKDCNVDGGGHVPGEQNPGQGPPDQGPPDGGNDGNPDKGPADGNDGGDPGQNPPAEGPPDQGQL